MEESVERSGKEIPKQPKPPQTVPKPEGKPLPSFLRMSRKLLISQPHSPAESKPKINRPIPRRTPHIETGQKSSKNSLQPLAQIPPSSGPGKDDFGLYLSYAVNLYERNQVSEAVYWIEKFISICKSRRHLLGESFGTALLAKYLYDLHSRKSTESDFFRRSKECTESALSISPPDLSLVLMLNLGFLESVSGNAKSVALIQSQVFDQAAQVLGFKSRSVFANQKVADLAAEVLAASLPNESCFGHFGFLAISDYCPEARIWVREGCLPPGQEAAKVSQAVLTGNEKMNIHIATILGGLRSFAAEDY